MHAVAAPIDWAVRVAFLAPSSLPSAAIFEKSGKSPESPELDKKSRGDPGLSPDFLSQSNSTGLLLKQTEPRNEISKKSYDVADFSQKSPEFNFETN